MDPWNCRELLAVSLLSSTSQLEYQPRYRSAFPPPPMPLKFFSTHPNHPTFKYIIDVIGTWLAYIKTLGQPETRFSMVRASGLQSDKKKVWSLGWQMHHPCAPSNPLYAAVQQLPPTAYHGSIIHEDWKGSGSCSHRLAPRPRRRAGRAHSVQVSDRYKHRGQRE